MVAVLVWSGGASIPDARLYGSIDCNSQEEMLEYSCAECPARMKDKCNKEEGDKINLCNVNAGGTTCNPPGSHSCDVNQYNDKFSDTPCDEIYD